MVADSYLRFEVAIRNRLRKLSVLFDAYSIIEASIRDRLCEAYVVLGDLGWPYRMARLLVGREALPGRFRRAAPFPEPRRIRRTAGRQHRKLMIEQLPLMSKHMFEH